MCPKLYFLFSKGFTKEKLDNAKKISFDEMVKNMQRSRGNPNEGWRRSDGFWGDVIVKCGLCNTEYSRRMVYDRWHKNWNDVQEAFKRTQSNCQVERE